MEHDSALKTVRRLTILAATFLVASLLISGYSIYFYTTLIAPLKDSVAPNTASLDDQQAMNYDVAIPILQDEETLASENIKVYGKPAMAAAYPFPNLEATTSSNLPIEIEEDNNYTLCECEDCFATGSYVGDDTDDRSIYVGFEPDAVLIFTSYGGYVIRNSAMSGDYACNHGDCRSNTIQAFEVDGFQVGQTAFVNGSPYTYYWLAWTDGN